MRHIQCKVKAGICYWPTYKSAAIITEDVRSEWPDVRIVSYDLGWAIQVRKSGDYLSPNLRPSMENRMMEFFA